jgi:hypothetical protein
MVNNNNLAMNMASDPAGYLQNYIEGIQKYKEESTGSPGFSFEHKYAQEQGGPLFQSYEVSGSPSFEIERPGYGPQVPDHLMMPVLERKYPGTLDKMEQLRNKLPDLVGIYKRV